MNTSSDSPDDHFNAQPPDRREQLLELRALIRTIWPKVKEDMSMGMPTFLLDGRPFCGLANQKHYMALYIVPYDLLTAFKMELKAYNCGRSCIRFRRLDDEKMIFFERVIKYTGSRFADSEFYRRPAERKLARA